MGTSRRLISSLTRTVQSKIRNVAIIAHVDHGKTTLVDCLLRHSGLFKEHDEQRLLDSSILEKERGITILSKCTSINHKGHKINLVDTPGHADFGGEVERALSLVDGALLVVDATEGPMAQTKYVLSKALKRDICPIIVLNKIDRISARPGEVDSELFDLFCSLGANEAQLSYPTIFAAAKYEWASAEPPPKGIWESGKGFRGSMGVLLDLIIGKVPPPKEPPGGPFKMLVGATETSPFLGRCYLGRVLAGQVSKGMPVKVLSEAGAIVSEGSVTRISTRSGLDLVPHLLIGHL